jgi:subtilase family serine protease
MQVLRPKRAGTVAAIGLAITAVAGVFSATASAAPHATGPHFVALSNSVSRTTDKIVGRYSSKRMSVEVALAPSHHTRLNSELRAVNTKGNASYHHWLRKGQFDKRFAPSSARRAAVVRYLQSQGLKISKVTSPFLVRAYGSSRQVSAAFRTTLSTYRDPHGVRYFSNSTAVRLPESISRGIDGVIGLTNSVREHSMVVRPLAKPASHKSSDHGTPSCETPYVTTSQLFNAVSNGVGFPYGYGGGPGCNGLTPSQANSLYNAPHGGPRVQGRGVTAAVFELSAYQQSDIQTWAQTFYGSHYTAPLTDVNVDGGPLNPVCPVGDVCPPSFNGYAGDIEVDADIEMTLAISPDLSNLIVYNAPNDYSGQTELDEYTAIANADQADTISSSWAVCENDVNAAYVEAENTVFEQMALQGQSMFGAEGDTGAFSCIRSDGTTISNVLDPPSQPWVTSVGGTSLENDNPGSNANPAPPGRNETVWNVDNLCNNAAPSAANDNAGGFFWCAETGAGGGGASQWWGRPFYQFGPNITQNTAADAPRGNGTTQCALATVGSLCREDPDVSINADEYTPYAEYCTGNANTPFSVCGTFSGGQTPPGWFGIGGTSLASPFWAAIIADRDGYQGFRSGNINPLLYLLYNLAYHHYFNDIGPQSNGPTTPGSNGLFPTISGYDMATGIGSPNMSAIITQSF